MSSAGEVAAAIVDLPSATAGVTSGLKPAGLRYGTVVSIQSTTLTITYMGSAAQTPGIIYLRSTYIPNVGDTVAIIAVGGDHLVIGATTPANRTVNGGPPSGSGAYVGQQIQDTKYGVTWWWDGSAWHANGPGLIKSSMYRSAAWTPTALGVVPYDAVPTGGDPLSLITLATSRFTCPIAGDYRVTAAVLSVAGVTPYMQLGVEINGSIVAYIGLGNSAGASEYAAANGPVRLLKRAAGDYLQLNLGMGTYLAQQVGANCCWAQFEFVSS